MNPLAKSLLAILGSAASAALAGAGPATDPVRELAFPEARASLETLHRSVAAVGRFGDRIIALAPGKASALVTPFDAAGATREAVFGKIEAGERREVVKGALGPLDWRAVDLVGNKALLFDGQGLTFVEADAATLAEVARRSVPWDTVRPPRDRGGEATAWETKDLRVRFARAVQATPGVKVIGLARIPAGWRGKVRGYFALTRLKGYPLLELECSDDDEMPSSCVVARACNVDGLGDVSPKDLFGAAAVERDGQKLILVGDASRQRIVALKYDTCFHVARARPEWVIPAKIKDAATFSVDADGALWVGARAPDDYLNASLYFWAKGDW